MELADWINKDLDGVIERLSKQQQEDKVLNSTSGIDMSGREGVYDVLDNLLSALFPGCHGREPVAEAGLEAFLRERLKFAAQNLGCQIERALIYASGFQKQVNGDTSPRERAKEITVHLIEKLPEIRTMLLTDLSAAYDGDPAALSLEVIVMSYPCVEAIATHRLAHVLYQQGVPLLPRIMSERSHSSTGIDIHPGAKIGQRFFIDHGTGVVVGETTHIGENVKLYQGVTLGALSFEKDEDGNPVKGIKRHPNIEDDVIVYSGASILGGETTIGKGSVIGGNVWITESVAPGSIVFNPKASLEIRKKR